MSSREVEPVEAVTDPMEMIAISLSEIDLSLKSIVHLYKNSVTHTTNNEQIHRAKKAMEVDDGKIYLIGINGASSFFHVTRTTFLKWKKTWLRPACEKNCSGEIKVDRDKAVELFMQTSLWNTPKYAHIVEKKYLNDVTQ